MDSYRGFVCLLFLRLAWHHLHSLRGEGKKDKEVDKSKHFLDRGDIQESALGKTVDSNGSLSVPHAGAGSPTLSALRYTTAERSAVSFSHACCLTAGRTRDE